MKVLSRLMKEFADMRPASLCAIPKPAGLPCAVRLQARINGRKKAGVHFPLANMRRFDAEDKQTQQATSWLLSRDSGR